jgi:subtilisin family serine protease
MKATNKQLWTTDRWSLRHLLLIVAVSALVVGPALAAKPADRPSNMSDAAHAKSRGNPHEMVNLIVTYASRPGAAARARVENAGGSVRHAFESIPGHAIRVPAHAATALARNPNVAWVTLDAPVRGAAVTPDSSGSSETVGSMSASELYPELGTISLTGDGVHLAVVDSGYKSHGDLKTPVSSSHVLGDSLLTTGDGYGHGNHVIGTIAGQGSNRDGDYRGIAPASKILSVRVLGDIGEGLTSDVIAGLDWAIAYMQSQIRYDHQPGQLPPRDHRGLRVVLR